ncbi:hypothetical protein NFHSH190041_19850 [Shewanella sp. NFH-SH190041]|uniref:host specificity factor TipJ family phage tail protein n=1 Tax=Shewanella sp. NFH-SH190041 TaxID=2950245 RepID=UPI0021C4334C|nr:host specificity factor TipJ family phage tail protein [Shewanella sp. NFH-SH190041]BDM64533.1 hypothetical protein NFHSH190041_19850 [Shewanella sp. NFH-SH190041]
MPTIIHFNHPTQKNGCTILSIKTGENLKNWVARELPAVGTLVVAVNFDELIDLDYVVKEHDVISLRPRLGELGTIALVAALVLSGASIVYTLMNMPDDTNHDTKQASSVYNYNAQGNQPKLGNPVPVCYGRMPHYPDIITPSWWEYVDNEQYVYQIFSKGVGRFLIHDHYIGETKLGIHNPDIECKVYEPGQPVDHFPHIVWTSKEVGGTDGKGGLELDGATGGWESTVDAQKAVFAGTKVDLYKVQSSSYGGTHETRVGWPWPAGRHVVITNSSKPSLIFEGNISFYDMGDDGSLINPDDLPDQIESATGWGFAKVGMRIIIDKAGVNSGTYRIKKILGHRIEVTNETGHDVTSFTPMAGVFVRISEAIGNDGVYVCKDDSGALALVDSDTLGEVEGWPGFIGMSSDTAVFTLYERDVESRWVGDFLAAPLDAEPLDIGLDFVWPRGLGEMDKNGNIIGRSSEWQVRVRLADSAEPYRYHNFVLTKADNTPQRATYWLSKEMNLPAGRYEIGCRRVTPFTDSTRIFDQVQWMGLKSLIQREYTNPHETIITLKIKATNALSQQANQQYWCDATRILPVRQHDGTFREQATRSIADAVIDACRDQVYGAGLNDEGIDFDTLPAYRDKWQQRGDTCDGIFDSATGFWDALGQILQTGRAYPRLDFGSVSMWRDEPRQALCKPYSPVNMLSDSFSADISLVEQGDYDSVEVEWFNPKSRKSETVLCKLPGHDGYNPKSLKLRFVTSEKQARAEGMFAAACQAYRRTNIEFSTDIDGWESNYGDLVPVSHDAVCWGQSGQILESQELQGSQYLRVTGLLEWETGKTHYILFNDGNAGVHGPYRVERTPEPDIIILLDKPVKPIFEVGERGQNPSQYMFGQADRMYKRCILQQVKQKGEYEVSCQAVEDDPRVDAYA